MDAGGPNAIVTWPNVRTVEDPAQCIAKIRAHMKTLDADLMKSRAGVFGGLGQLGQAVPGGVHAKSHLEKLAAAIQHQRGACRFKHEESNCYVSAQILRVHDEKKSLFFEIVPETGPDAGEAILVTPDQIKPSDGPTNPVARSNANRRAAAAA